MADAADSGHSLAILIVAYRSADKLEKCLRAVNEQLPLFDVYVWDNSGPSHTAVRELAVTFQHVRWHTKSDNIGFAAAVNELAAMVPGRDMLLLNPDAELLGPLTLTRSAIREPGVAAAAPMVTGGGVVRRVPSLLSRDQMPWDVAHRRVTFLNSLCGFSFSPELFRGSCLSDRYRTKPEEVAGYLTGACLAIRRDAWNAVGPLDEEFFLYGEEAEWQSRARAAGWVLRLADETDIQHAAQGTVAGDSLASMRSQDLLRAGVALQVEYRYGVFAAGFFIALVSLVEHVKNRLRRRQPSRTPSDVLITVNANEDQASIDGRVALGIQLSAQGHNVVIVSLNRLGVLPRDVPTSIRLIRRPWWWPTLAPDVTPSVLIAGRTTSERRFTRLFRLGRKRVRIPFAEASTLLDPLQSPSDAASNPPADGS